MKFRIMGLALSLCLVLSSCGGQDGGGQASLLAQAAGWDDTQTLLVIGEMCIRDRPCPGRDRSASG